MKTPKEKEIEEYNRLVKQGTKEIKLLHRIIDENTSYISTLKAEQRKKFEDLKRFREYVACGDCPVCNGKFTETICWRILDFDQLLDKASKEEK